MFLQKALHGARSKIEHQVGAATRKSRVISRKPSNGAGGVLAFVYEPTACRAAIEIRPRPSKMTRFM